MIRTALFNILKKYKLTNVKNIRNFKQQNDYANKDVDIRIDKHIHTDCNVKFNKPDITLIDKKEKKI